MENKLIYFDNAATTRVDPHVLSIFNNTISENFANPSSIHKEGQRAFYLFNSSKEEILKLLNYKDGQVIYLSGATEANNLAIKGVAFRYKSRGRHLITSTYEHPSVLEVFRQLEKEFGYEVSYVSPNKDGVIETSEIEKLIRNDTILVSIMAVNNEIGAINPIKEISNLLEKYPKILFHVDASQAIGKIDIDYSKVDLLTISSHKIHGLKSFGCLVKKKKIELLSVNSGGGQEYNYRSGTEDLANALAFLEALKISIVEQKKRYEYVSTLSSHLLAYLKEHEDLYELNVPSPINPYIINFSSRTKKGSVIVEALSNHNIMVSSISACHSSKETSSYVIKAIGKSESIAHNTIRVSFDHNNTVEEIDVFTSTLEKIIGDIR